MTKPLTSDTSSGSELYRPESVSPAYQAQVASDQGFSEIVENYADFAYNVAYRMLRNVEDAEDAVQEAFVSAYRAYSKFKGQSKVST